MKLWGIGCTIVELSFGYGQRHSGVEQDGVEVNSFIVWAKGVGEVSKRPAPIVGKFPCVEIVARKPRGMR